MLLNPFRGALAVVESDDGRASSRDGRHWRIETLASPPRDLWAETSPSTPKRYYAFGEWSHETGLRKVPLSPMLDSHTMVHAARRLIDLLPIMEQRLPFPFRETRELWLLDPQENRPMYLVAVGAKPPALSPTIDWDFPDAPGDTVRSGRAVAQILKRAAGDRSVMRWFERETGNGPLPELPFATVFSNHTEQAILEDYINGLAPQLLTLPTLKKKTRARLERLAAQQPEAVARLWRLYPCILDERLLKRNRVAARIGQANRR